MESLSREIVFLILQFLDEEKFEETAHKLEKESGLFFNMKYLEDCVLGGEWEEVEKYLAGFIKVEDNRYSAKIMFDIRKQKYLEALDNNDRVKAVEILIKDFTVFSTIHEDLVKDVTHLITLDNFRENAQLSKYTDAKTGRILLLKELKPVIEANPVLREKLKPQPLKTLRLRTLINQSLNWQYTMCKNPRPSPDVTTLLYDHSCRIPKSTPCRPSLPSPTPHFMNVAPKPESFSQMAVHGPFPSQPLCLPSLGRFANAHPMVYSTVSGCPIYSSTPPNTVIGTHLKCSLTPISSENVDYHSADQEHEVKRPRRMGTSDQVVQLPTHLPVGYTSIAQNQHSLAELPKNVAVTLNQGSSVMSMDFHPSLSTILLVGTNVGDIALWDVALGEMRVGENFNVWDLLACSMRFQSVLDIDPATSINRVLWNHDGSQFGVAYSKHLVHLYNYDGGEDLRHHLEIDAHVGGVNDLAFSQPNKQLCVVTCGDDKTIKVWDAITGTVQLTLEGHATPVYSICPHTKEKIDFIFSTSLDGKIKAWLYENRGPKVDYAAPGHWCTTMAYSADGTRLFSCGTSKEGNTYIVEWHESEGSAKRSYRGFRKRSNGVVQFDVTNNRFIAAGDEFLVKFWDMDNIDLLATTDAGGGLPASPRVRFSKSGSLLAVSTNDNCIKILANADGFQLLRSINILSCNATRPATEAVTKQIAETQSLGDVDSRIIEESIEQCKTWKLAEIIEPSQICSLRLPDSLVAKVPRLLYVNSGVAILALASNGVHKIWRWQKTSGNGTGKASTSVPPKIWEPAPGLVITNEMSDANQEQSIHSLALTKNDSYFMSASGGSVSLFNMMTFDTMATFMAPPQTATFLAFHPRDNNIIAIGMNDSTIQIYSVRTDKVICTIRGHRKRVTCLAFSTPLNILVSSGADAQLCLWVIDGWGKLDSTFLQLPAGQLSTTLAETSVHFHNDQTHFLVVHEMQLAIYEATRLKCLQKWAPSDGLITSATYSCDNQMIYASSMDGIVRVFTSALQLRCLIKPSAYLGTELNVSPLVVAANPVEPRQFALGLTDGGILVLEPSESEGGWGTMPGSVNS